MNPELDGVNHINIYSKSKNILGRWLSNFAYSPITTEHGDFLSIEGYWYWLQVRDDNLRTKWGYDAKKCGKALKADDVIFIENFNEYIKKAIDIKLKSDRKKLKEFKDSILPFTHYYVFGGMYKDAGFKWIVDHFEDRRRLLKECLKKPK